MSTQAQIIESPAVMMKPSVLLAPLEMIDVQRRQIKRKEYEPCGRLARIELAEGCLPNAAPDNPFRQRDPRFIAHGVALDWKTLGPVMGRTKDGMDLLCLEHTVHPPPLEDPNWVRKREPRWNAQDKRFDLEPPALMEQSLLDRAWIPPDVEWIKVGKRYKPRGPWFLAGSKQERWLLFQPVAQIVLYTLGKSGVMIYQCSADEAGRHTVFAYDRERHEGHILFGKKRLKNYERV